MAYDLQEQESIDQMKAWWDRWGTPVTAAVCVVCLGFAGWNGWNWYKRNQATEASVAYVQLQNAVFHKDVKNRSASRSAARTDEARSLSITASAPRRRRLKPATSPKPPRCSTG